MHFFRSFSELQRTLGFSKLICSNIIHNFTMSESTTMDQDAYSRFLNRIDFDPIITKKDAMEIIPEMFQVSIERYFRGPGEFPPDYVQKEADIITAVTKKDLLNSLDPRLVKSRSHVMVVGAAGTGKTLVMERIEEESYDSDRLFVEQDFMFIRIEPDYYPADSIISLPQFFLHKKFFPDYDSETVDTIFGCMVENSAKVVFWLDGLDTVNCKFEKDCKEINLSSTATPPVILHNLLTGKIFRDCKIVSSCRSYRLETLPPKLLPDKIFQLGELTNVFKLKSALLMSGWQCFEGVHDNMEENDNSLYVLTKNTAYLRYYILSIGMIDPYKFTDTMPMIMLKVVLSCVYKKQYPHPPKDKEKRDLKIIHKMKKIAYYGLQEFKNVFDEKDLKRSNLTLEEIDSVTNKFPVGVEFSPLCPLNNGSAMFCCHQTLDFFCALHVVELPIFEYKTFLKECIHTPRYNIVRRMVCSLLLDPEVNRVALMEDVLDGSVMDLRRSLLQESMHEQYHKLERRDLLEFFHAVRDCSSEIGMIGILPKKVDTVDFSHIQLFSLDMEAIGISLSNCKTVEYLNLSNCCVTTYGLWGLAVSCTHRQLQIKRLNLDWNTDWTNSDKRIEALSDIIKLCQVEDLSINHNEMTVSYLDSLSKKLGKTKVKTLRIQHNTDLGEDEFTTLRSFVLNHHVEQLFISGEEARCLITTTGGLKDLP